MRRLTTFFLLSLISLPMLSACDRSSGKAEPAEGPRSDLELRVYTVPAEATDRLRAAVFESLRIDEKARVGSVSSPAPGQLLVLAPGRLQESISGALKELASSDNSKSAPAAQYRLRFWVVDALRGDGADDPALAEVAAATAEAHKQLGAVHFALRNTVGAVSRAQFEVRKRWSDAGASDASPDINRLNYKLFGSPDGLNLEITYAEDFPREVAKDKQYFSNEMSTTVPIRLGQLLVLSQSPAGAAQDAKATPQSAARLYIVRVDSISGA